MLGITAERLPATFELAFASLAFAALLGGAVAVFATLVSDWTAAPLIDGVNGLFLAVPDFIWAFALVLLFGVFLPALPLSAESILASTSALSPRSTCPEPRHVAVRRRR